MDRMAIILKENSSMLQTLKGQINKRYDFERVDSQNPVGSHPTILINFGLINKRHSEKVEEVAQMLGISEDNHPHIEDYGLVNTGRIESIEADQLSDGMSRGMSR